MSREKMKKLSWLQLWNLKTLLQRRRIHGGETNLYYPICLLAIGILNFINQTTLGKDIIERSYFTLPFIFLSAIIYFIPFRKIILAYIFLFLGIGVHYFMIDPSGFSAISLFVLAYANRKSKPFTAILLLSTIIIVTYKATISGDSPPQVISTMILFAFLYGSFYNDIFSKIEKPASIKIDDLSETENKLLSGLASGQSQKTTIANMGLSQSQGYDTVKKIKEKMNSDSMDEIMFNLGRNKYSKIRQ